MINIYSNCDIYFEISTPPIELLQLTIFAEKRLKGYSVENPRLVMESHARINLPGNFVAARRIILLAHDQITGVSRLGHARFFEWKIIVVAKLLEYAFHADIDA